MDETTIRVLFLIGGVVVGWGLGMLHTANRYAKRIKDNTEYCRAVIQRRLDDQPIAVPNSEAREKDGSAGRSSFRKTLRPASTQERGGINLMTVGMVIALAVVLISLVSTLNTNAKVADTQDELAAQGQIRDRENTCTSQVLFGVVAAITERTDKTSTQNAASVALQQSQLRFLTALTKPGADFETALDAYVKAGTEFVRAYGESQATAANNPYPTEAQYAECLRMAREPRDE